MSAQLRFYASHLTGVDIDGPFDLALDAGITIECWAYPRSMTRERQVFLALQGGPDDAAIEIATLEYGVVEARVTVAGTETTVRSENRIEYRWVHVAATVSPTGAIVLRVDDAIEAEGSAKPLPSGAYEGVRIAHRGETAFFSGDVAEARIWERSDPPTLAARATGSEPGLAAGWPLDDAPLTDGATAETARAVGPKGRPGAVHFQTSWVGTADDETFPPQVNTRTEQICVPTTIEALVVNPDDRDDPDARTIDRTPNYEALDHPESPLMHGAELEATPCTEGVLPTQRRVLDEPGVHLHWALPDALTHGDSYSDAAFPKLPDRWVVFRRVEAPEGVVAPPERTWLVVSNYLGAPYDPHEPFADAQRGSRLWPSFDHQGRVTLRPLGAVFEAGDWDDLWYDRVNELSAVGPGEPTFAASYLHARNVLGMHDDLSDLPAHADGDVYKLHYAVVGWYSNYSNDYLGQYETEVETLSALRDAGWSLANTRGVRAYGTVVHGATYDVPWPRPGDFAPAAHEADAPRVAIGNTTEEAMGALIASDEDGEMDVGVARLWEAIQYELLERLGEHDDVATLDAETHERSFEADNGGRRYTLRRDPDGGTFEELETPQNAQPPTPEIEAALAAYNESQEEAERYTWRTDDLRRLAWACWVWSQEAGPGEAPDVGGWPGRLDLLHFADEHVRPAVEAEERVRDDWSRRAGFFPETVKTDVLHELDPAKGHLPPWTFEEITAPRFYRPADPVVVVTRRAKASHKHGADDRLRADGTLSCRLAAQLPPLDPNHANAPLPPNTPAVVERLRSEWLGLLPSAVGGGAQRPAASPGDLPEQPTPAFITRAAARWRDPWSPLIFEWQADWSSTYDGHRVGAARSALTALENMWRMGRVDFEYVGEHLLEDRPAEVVSGRAVVSRHAPQVVSARLHQYAESLEDRATGTALLDLALRLKDVDVLAQPLSGLTDRLLQRQTPIEIPFRARTLIADEVGTEAFDRAQRWSKLTREARDVFPDPDLDFQPLRSGSLALRKLWFADAFGRLMKVEEAATGDDGATPIDELLAVAENLRPPDRLRKEGAVLLPPRICQPSRVMFRWIDAAHETIGPYSEITETAPRSLIAGWLVPDRASDGLWVFDDRGSPLGEIVLVGSGEGARCRWDDAPGVTFDGALRGPSGAPELENPHLARVVDALCDGPLSGATFARFLEQADEAIAGIDPPSGSGFTGEVAVMGRPLAVTRASAKLELKGLPAIDMHPEHLRNFATSTWDDLELDFYLGDPERLRDGLLLWNRDGEPQTWNVVAGDTTPAPLALAPKDDPVGLTLVMDPRVDVHLRSGWLPTKAISVPTKILDDAIEVIEPTFAVGPLLLRDEAPRLPLPETVDRSWSLMLPEPGGAAPTAWRHFDAQDPDRPGPADGSGALGIADDRAAFRPEAIIAVDGRLRWGRHATPLSAMEHPPLTAFLGPTEGALDTPRPGPVAAPARAVPDHAEPTVAVEPDVVTQAPPPYPGAIVVHSGSVAISDVGHATEIESSVLLHLEFPPRYQHAPTRPDDVESVDSVFVWFLYEDVPPGRVAVVERGRDRVLCPYAHADAITFNPVGDATEGWSATLLRGFEANGTGKCWRLRPKGGLLSGPDAAQGATFRVDGLVASSLGSAVVVAQAYVAGRHTDFAYTSIEKKAPALRIVSFRGSPRGWVGDRVRLRWRVLGARVVTLNSNADDPNDPGITVTGTSLWVDPPTYGATYTLTATAHDGSQVTRSVVIEPAWRPLLVPRLERGRAQHVMQDWLRTHTVFEREVPERRAEATAWFATIKSDESLTEAERERISEALEIAVRADVPRHPGPDVDPESYDVWLEEAERFDAIWKRLTDVPEWTSFELEVPRPFAWTDDEDDPTGLLRDANDRIQFRGRLVLRRARRFHRPETLFVLPNDHRPKSPLEVEVPTADGVGRIAIDTRGVASLVSSETAWIDLDGIDFPGA